LGSLLALPTNSRPVRDKRSSLLCKVETNGRKKFYNIGHRSNDGPGINLFAASNNVVRSNTVFGNYNHYQRNPWGGRGEITVRLGCRKGHGIQDNDT
jgi:hypothetical protein